MSEPDIMYVLICIEISVDKAFGSAYSVEPVGVFDDLDQAISYATELEGLQKSLENLNVTFDVLEFELNEKPQILRYLEQTNKKLEDSITSVLISLMKRGLIDQLVGEDGNFYYELTEKGVKMKKDIPEIVQKLFRKRGDKGDLNES